MLYYSCGKFPKICVICGTSRSLQPDGNINFPHCKSLRVKISRRGEMEEENRTTVHFLVVVFKRTVSVIHFLVSS